MSKIDYKNIIVSISFIFIYFVWSYLVEEIVDIFHLSGSYVLWGKFIIYLLLLVGGILFYHREFKRAFFDFNREKFKYFSKGLKSFIVGYGLYFIISLIIKLLFPEIYFDNSGNIGFSSIPVLFVFFSVIYYPIMEEVVFKVSLRKILTNKWLFIIITGVFNAFFQVAFSASKPIDFLMFIPDCIFYMSLSYIYFETDNIVVDIFYRMLSNLLPVMATVISVAYVFR